ncbi:hypothetical protein [Rossellomorea vietnamensis]|uniref:hypothetical protein n=1 Tax=Rossellomorea vietnamensis TaxID=218284 RepID=UPI002078BD5B|nr:hypothetical protein [Rossellomorea vietnamensis]
MRKGITESDSDSMMTYRKERVRNLLVAKSVPVGTDPRPLELDETRLRLYKKWKSPDQTRQANVLKRKKMLFPFTFLRLFDPEGLGGATRRPQVPQNVARLPLQSFYK